MKKQIQIGIIGAGRIGRVHAENTKYFIRSTNPVMIADANFTAAEKAASEYEIPQAKEDYRAIFDNRNIEAVLICSSTDTHAQIIREAAEAGKHIFCEKPIDLDLKRIEKVLDNLEKTNVKFQVGFNRRFDNNFLSLKQKITAGAIGQLHILRISSRDPAPPPLAYLQVSGGMFLDMTIHDFDMARFLTESEVKEVFASGAVLIDPKIKEVNDIDTAIITLKFENGIIGTIDNSRQAVYGYDQRIEAFGSKGMVQAENTTPDRIITHTSGSVQTTNPHYFFLERYRQAYINEIEAFADAIINDKKPLVSGIDGMMPIKIGLAAKLSLRENRPVQIGEIDNRII